MEVWDFLSQRGKTMEFATQCKVKGRVGGGNSQVAAQITSSGRIRAVMVRSQGGSKGLSYKRGSVGQLRRAEEDPVCCGILQEKVELGL